MGGGDLNSKKSWHPNTMKNQERVWKAEQAAEEERKRIMELQREHAADRDRTELNDMIKKRNDVEDDHRLQWMYEKPDKKAHQEDYLLGKAIDKTFDSTDKPEQDSTIPAVARRVVGSSMLTASSDAQVDIARKIKEDPLLLIKERERAARAALLNNPLHRKKITELLRKEQEQRKENKEKKKPKKNDLDDKLAAKLNALGSEKNIDLAALLASDDSSDSTSEDDKPKKKKKKKKDKKSKKSKKKRKSSDSEVAPTKTEHKSKRAKNSISPSRETQANSRREHKSKEVKRSVSPERESRKRKSDSEDDDRLVKKHRSKSHLYVKYKESNDRYKSERMKEKSRSPERRKSLETRKSKHGSSKISDRSSLYRKDQSGDTSRSKLSEQERAARLAEMAAAGEQREVERGKRVAEQRAADAVAENSSRRPAVASHARALPDSLQARIHSNRHYIQRDKRHMNEHFARR